MHSTEKLQIISHLPISSLLPLIIPGVSSPSVFSYLWLRDQNWRAVTLSARQLYVYVYQPVSQCRINMFIRILSEQNPNSVSLSYRSAISHSNDNANENVSVFIQIWVSQYRTCRQHCERKCQNHSLVVLNSQSKKVFKLFQKKVLKK